MVIQRCKPEMKVREQIWKGGHEEISWRQWFPAVAAQAMNVSSMEGKYALLLFSGTKQNKKDLFVHSFIYFACISTPAGVRAAYVGVNCLFPSCESQGQS